MKVVPDVGKVAFSRYSSAPREIHSPNSTDTRQRIKGSTALVALPAYRMPFHLLPLPAALPGMLASGQVGKLVLEAVDASEHVDEA
jgi:hypothetical protein